MRPLLGRTAQALARRGTGLERVASLTLERDRDADPPGATLALALGERTAYRMGATVADDFLGGELASRFAPWTDPAGFGALVLEAPGRIVPAAVGVDVERFLTAAPELHRDQWAQVTLVELASEDSGGLASGGVGLRLSPPEGGTGRGYLVLAVVEAGGAPRTVIARYRSGALEATLLDEAHPWAAGDVLRASVDWARLRVYRNDVLVATVLDELPLLVKGRAGLEAVTLLGTDAAVLTDFVAGPLREETVGLLTDAGDVSQSLGILEPTSTPARFSVGLVNLAPVGGAARFSDLVRHGRNRGANTYDLLRSPITVRAGLSRTPTPIVTGTGRVRTAAGLTVDRLRLECEGPDAFLEPRIEPGSVVYISSSAPTTAPELPEDPCADPDPPDVVPGDPPAEPDPDPAPPIEDEDPEPPGEGLLGLWLIFMDYSLDFGGGPMGEDVYTGTTIVYQLPDEITSAFPLYTASQLNDATDHDHLQLEVQQIVGAGSESFPERLVWVLVYRGPDIGGTDLKKLATPYAQQVETSCLPGTPGIRVRQVAMLSTYGLPERGITVKLGNYSGEGITSREDLQALRPQNPSELSDPFPERIDTAEEWGLQATQTEETNIAEDVAIPTNAFVGPQILRLELISPWVGSDVNRVVGAIIRTQLLPGGSSIATPCDPHGGSVIGFVSLE